eukprot:gene4339-biopygen3929
MGGKAAQQAPLQGGMEEHIEKKGCGAAGAAQGERLNTCSVCATEPWGRKTQSIPFGGITFLIH